MPKKNLIMLVGILLLVSGVIVAQENTTVLSIAVPNQMADALNNGILDQFETANPGVQVHVIETGGGRFGGANNAQSDIEGFLDGVEESVTEADVLLVNSSDLTPETTRAGYYLDIAPLVGADAALAPGDFYPSFGNRTSGMVQCGGCRLLRMSSRCYMTRWRLIRLDWRILRCGGHLPSWNKRFVDWRCTTMLVIWKLLPWLI